MYDIQKEFQNMAHKTNGTEITVQIALGFL